DSTSGGINLEAVRGAKSPNVFSARVSQGLRAILARDGGQHVLLHVDQHDDAYEWARRHRVDRHPVTGVLQLVTVPEVAVPKLVAQEKPPAVPGLFDAHEDAYLLSLGLPEDWLPVLRKVTNDDELLDVLHELPDEVADRLVDVAAGRLVTPPAPVAADQPLDAVPDQRRRFYVVRDAEELTEILAKPLAAWLRYLHPSQRELVDRSHRGAVKVTGSAGTGKTVVAMHRAVHLARQKKRVLLTSYVTTLCQNLAANVDLLCRGAERERIKVQTVDKTALAFCRAAGLNLHPTTDEKVRDRLKAAIAVAGAPMDEGFLLAELDQVIVAQAIRTWDEYRAASRTGRGRPLSVRDRKTAWTVLGRVVDDLLESGRVPWSFLCRAAREKLEAGEADSPYDAVVVDELQDLGPEQIRFLAALCPDPAALMVVGDAGQRIYPGGFSLRRLGVDVRGRSHVLRINYRTTEQIRRAADALLGDRVDDMDGAAEPRDARSLLNGPEPALHGFGTEDEQLAFLAERIAALRDEGLALSEIGVFAPYNNQVEKLAEGLRAADVRVHVLGPDDHLEADDGVRLGTMHRAKGLEFKAVFATFCSAGCIPASFVRKIKDPAEREVAEAQQRRLLYVVMTRARDELTVSWVGQRTPYLAERRPLRSGAVR
ncbi:MAG: 3'-5' exonuclease, partial [Planctomycetota bacterium JB042]